MGEPNSSYNFMATVSSEFTTQPITYTWQIDNQAPFTHTNALFDVINTNWADLGIHTITVTAENETGTAVTDTHTITILEPKIYLPIVVND